MTVALRTPGWCPGEAWSRLGVPESGATEQAGDVVDPLDVRGERDGDVLRVATTDVEAVEPQQDIHRAHRARHLPVPTGLAETLPVGVAQHLVVGLVLAERVLAQ